MSPRGTSISPTQAASPNANRASLQAKSSRRQFSACGACRMRRVRCDLKDLPPSASNHTPCSNCKERGLNCIDEYADVKATKLLRRGRRLQQVEAIYGKVKNTDKRIFSSRVPSNIPSLKGDFFSSRFWAWFCIQRPVLDPNEFPQRYLAHIEGKSAIDPEGMILAMLLVLWAASFGLDESGAPVGTDVDSDMHQDIETMLPRKVSLNSQAAVSGSPSQAEFLQIGKRPGQQKINMMLQQILEHIDSHGILRRPTLDGARILLLILPLMEEYPYLEKAAMHEAALSHTRTLCNPRGSLLLQASPLPSTADGSPLLSRIFLYAHIQDGISTTLKSSSPVFQSEDIDTLQRMISLSTNHSSLTTSLPEFSNRNGLDMGKQLMQLTSMPMRLGSVCRKVHDVLTGLKTTRRIGEHNLLDANGMREAWRELEQCWHGFVAMRSDPFTDFKKASIECFTDAWLICIFECHYAILESLKRLSSNTESGGLGANISDCNGSSRPTSAFSSSPSTPYLPPHQLYLEGRTRCVHLLPHVLRIIRYHLTRSSVDVEAPNFFSWDTGLIRDGCFFAGLLSADLYGSTQCLDEHPVKPEETDDCITPEEGVNLILSALAEMHWVFSKHEERADTIRSALQRNKEKYNGRSYSRLLPNPSVPANSYVEHNQGLPYSLHSYSHSHRNDMDVVGGPRERRIPPNLNMSLLSQRRVESAPNTACSTTSGWTHYTPPATASTAPIPSSRGSPDFDGPFNAQDDAIFSFMPVISDALDDFDQSTTTRTTTSVFSDRIYQHRDTLYNTHDIPVTVDATSGVLGL